MRKINAVITPIILVLFLVHMIWGGLELAGMTKGGNALFSVLSRLLLALVCVHVLVSVWLTVRTLRTVRRSGASYTKENRLFWIRRGSGLALMLLLAAHVLLMSGTTRSGAYRLNLFAGSQLAVQILMVLALLVHLACNITPLRIALGLEDPRKLRIDLLLVLTVLLLLAGAAFVIYFIRWQMV